MVWYLVYSVCRVQDLVGKGLGDIDLGLGI